RACAALREQPHDRQRREALAAARLADEAEDFPALEVEADAIDGFDHPAPQEEVGDEVAYLENVVAAHSWRNLGSNRSRSQSPNRLTDRTSAVIASPGIRETHHASAMRPRPSETIRPQVGVGGGMPAPRKLSAASAKITTPMLSVSRTMNVLSTFGRMCVSIMRTSEHPRTLARATKSRCFKASTSPRMIRAKGAQSSRLMAITSVP